MPTLLESAGLPIPSTVQGQSFLRLLDRRTEGWRNEVLFETSEFFTGRGLRTPQYTYAAVVPKSPGWRDAASADRYVEYMLYDNYADPYQHVNLAGRATHRAVAEDLRKRLVARIAESGGPPATIDPCWFPYS
jgi:arylsulfatase A-like enzyme